VSVTVVIIRQSSMNIRSVKARIVTLASYVDCESQLLKLVDCVWFGHYFTSTSTGVQSHHRVLLICTINLPQVLQIVLPVTRSISLFITSPAPMLFVDARLRSLAHTRPDRHHIQLAELHPTHRTQRLSVPQQPQVHGTSFLSP